MLLLLLGCVTGCGGPTYDVAVSVRNQSNRPVEVWMVKDGTPVEAAWLSPGQFVLNFAPDEQEVADRPSLVLPAGEVGRVGPRPGRFPSGARPVLHVYESDQSVTALASTSRGSGLMDAVRLGFGQNYVLVDSAMPVTARRVDDVTFLEALHGEEADGE